MRGARLLVPAVVTLLVTCDGADSVATRGVHGAAGVVLADGPGVLVARGESLFMASAFDSAEATWSIALADARASHDTLAEARILTWLGQSARMRGDGTRAREYIDAGLALKVDHLDSAEAGESYNALGLLALDEDRLVDARAAFERALSSGGDRRLVAKAHGNLGLALAYVGDLDEARRRIATMLDSSVALGERRFEANALANLAMLDIWEGRAAAALPTLGRAREIYRVLDYAPGEQNALGQRAVALEGLGEYGAAFAALDSSLAIARDKGMREDEAEILRLIAGLHARLGDLPAALRHYHAAAQAADSVGAAGEAGSIRRSMADVHLQLGNVGRARHDALAALRTHQRLAARVDEVDDLIVLARVEQRHGDEGEAARRMHEAVTLAATIGAPSLIRSVALEDARLADVAGDPERALRALQVFARDRSRADVAQLADADAMTARAWARRGHLDSAVAAGGRAIDGLARLREGLASEPLRRALIADRSRVYGDQVLALLRLGRVVDAFAVSDAARSRGLIEHLASARDSGVVAGAEGERLLREIDAVLRLRDRMVRLLPNERGSAIAATEAHLDRRLEQARARYEAFLARSSGRGIPGSGAASVTMTEVQAALDDGERLLEYLVTGDRLVLFVVSPDTVRAVELDADVAAITERVRVLRETWGHRSEGWREALPAARALFRTLVDPVREIGLLQGATRLVIVPHGVLSQLPFGALREPGRERWLVEEAELLYIPSAAALPTLRRATVPRTRMLGHAAFAPFPEQLPATRGEVRAVRDAAPGGRAFLGSGASEATVRRELSAPRVVHLATHGVMNARNPMFSRVELAPPRRPSLRPDDDGRLEVHELLGMTIRSPLVFLAGCETSAFQAWLDDPVRGTDHTTLAQAFLQSGAENVAGTLWRIDDEGAAVFATAFYQALHGESPVRALASTQRRLLADPRHANPYFWASYLLSGSGALQEPAKVGSRSSVPSARRAVQEPLRQEP